MKPWVDYFRKYSLISSALIVCIIAIFVMFGWFFSYEPLIRISVRFAAMVFNTALCFLFLGMAQVLILFQYRKISQILSVFVLALAFLSGLQYLIRVNFGIDQLFFPYNLSEPMDFPGRMSLNTAVCFSFLAAALFIFTLKEKKNYILIALLLLSIIQSIAGVSFIGYITGLEGAAGWANFSRMAVHTSVCFLILSFPLLFSSLIDSLNNHLIRYALPFSGFLVSLIATLVIWQAFNAKEYLSIHNAAKINANFVQYAIEEKLLEHTLALVRMADRWGSLEEFPEVLWKKDSSNYLRDIKSLEKIEIFDEKFQPIKRASIGMAYVAPSNVENPVFQKRVKSLETFILFRLKPPSIYISIPFNIYGQFKGVLVAALSAEKLIEEALKKTNFPDYLFVFQNENRQFYATGNFQSKTVGAPLIEKFDSDLLPWNLKLYITKSTLLLEGEGVGVLVLAGGLFFSLLIAIATYFGVDVFEKSALIKKNGELLKEANKKAEEANVAKGLFLANMSHEIRTPLNAVIGTIQLLEETNTDDTQKKYISRIGSSSKALLALIKDILDYSKIESGTVSLQPTEVSLEGLFKKIVQDLSFKAKEKSLGLYLELPAEPMGNVQVDEYRLGQVISNLINNSIKFTEKGHILLRASLIQEEGKAPITRIEIQDTGIGIAKEDASKLFEKFSQVESSEARKFGGVGLGLSICKKLIEMMGGQIGLISDKGKGSTFWMQIPLEVKPTEQEPRHFTQNEGYLLLDSSEKEKQIIGNTLNQWGLSEKQEGARFVLASEDQLGAAQGINLPVLLLTDSEIGQLPDKVSGYLSRPVVPSSLYELIKKVLTG